MAVVIPIFYPSVTAVPTGSRSQRRLAQVGRFRECDDCPIYTTSLSQRTGIAQGRDERIVTTSGTTATFRLQENHLTSPSKANAFERSRMHCLRRQLTPPTYAANFAYAANFEGCIWWNNQRTQRFATAVTTTHLGLPRSNKPPANATQYRSKRINR